MLTFLKRFLSFPSDKKTRYIRDAQGRIVIHHGVNISNYSKHSGPPGETRPRAGHPWHGEQEAANLQAWGFNLVRYLVHWEAIEPTRGTYNEAYLDRVIEDIEMYGRHGIEVVVDFHQDLFAQKFHGNGFPEWAAIDNGKPFKLQEPWAMNYFQPAVKESFKNFWKNKDGLLDSYIAAVEHVYLKVRTCSNVLGVDVMNEPWPEGWFLTFERTDLSNFYDRLKEVWLKHGNGYPYLMFEPWMSTSAGYPTNLRMDNERFIGAVYMPHYYDFFCEQGKPYGWFNKIAMKRALNIRCSEAQEFKCPMIFGEFRFPVVSKNYREAFSDFYQLCDEHSVGWTYWSYDKLVHNDRGLINDDGTPASNSILFDLVRIYPKRIVGEGARYGFDGNVFTMSWKSTGDCGLVEIYVPAAWDVVIETENPYRVSGDTLFVTSYPKGCKNKVTVTVKSKNGFPQ